MKFLVVAQDLRVNGTSEGIVSRSFIAKLKLTYPKAIIDILYIKNHNKEDHLHLLPVRNIETHIINLKPTFFVKWINRFTRLFFNYSWYDRYIHKSFSKPMAKVDSDLYSHIFIRSAGLNHETILGAKDLPILKKAIINFHDPYPFFWYQGSNENLTVVELKRFFNMYKVVNQAKVCVSTANMMSHGLEFLYGSNKPFYTLPHQFSKEVFDFSDRTHALQKNDKFTIAYHGSIQFGRKVETLIEAYIRILNSNMKLEENTELILRIGGGNVNVLKEKYRSFKNIHILPTLNFSNSSYEQMYTTDINVILENGPLYCNILVGKAPFLAFIKKPVFCLSPKKSELRQIITDEKYIADSNNLLEVEHKLTALINERLNCKEEIYPFGDYFSDENFKKKINEILEENER